MFSEIATDDLDWTVDWPNSHDVGTWVKIQGNDRRLDDIVLDNGSPAVNFNIIVPDDQGIGTCPNSKLFTAGSPLARHHWQFSVNVNHHFVPFFGVLFPYKDTAIVTDSQYFFIDGPVYLTNSLRMIGDLLQNLPWIDVIKSLDLKNIDSCISFGSNGTISSVLRKRQRWDTVLLQEVTILEFLHFISFAGQ